MIITIYRGILLLTIGIGIWMLIAPSALGMIITEVLLVLSLVGSIWMLVYTIIYHNTVTVPQQQHIEYLLKSIQALLQQESKQ